MTLFELGWHSPLVSKLYVSKLSHLKIFPIGHFDPSL
jgi:hypothetical protein